MEITACVTDADYEDWRRVRIAVIPYERTQSLAELRAGDTPERLLLLARDGDTVVGPRAGPARRERGSAAARSSRACWRSTAAGASAPRCCTGSPTTSPRSACRWSAPAPTTRPSLAFAQRFGFVEVNREVEQTYVVTGRA